MKKTPEPTGWQVFRGLSGWALAMIGLAMISDIQEQLPTWYKATVGGYILLYSVLYSFMGSVFVHAPTAFIRYKN